MGFLEFGGAYQLELFLTDRGKQKMMELNGKGLADFLGGSITNPSGVINGDGKFYLSDSDFNYETLETLSDGGTGECQPIVPKSFQSSSIAGSGFTTPSNSMPCFFGIPDVRGQRNTINDHCIWYTGLTSVTGMSQHTNVYVFYDQAASSDSHQTLLKTSPPHLASQAHFYSAVTEWFTSYQTKTPSHTGEMFHFVMDEANEVSTIDSTYAGHGRYLRWAAFPAYQILAGVKNSPPPGRVDGIASNFWPLGANWVPGDGTGILETISPDSDVFCIFFMGSSESYAASSPFTPAYPPDGLSVDDWDGMNTNAGLGGNYQQDWEYFAGKTANNYTSNQTSWTTGNIGSYWEGEGALDYYRNTTDYGAIRRGGFIGLVFPIATTGGTGVSQYSSFNLHLYGAIEAGNSSGNGTVIAPNTDNPNLCLDYNALTLSNPYYSADLMGPGNLHGLKNLGFVADLTQSFSTNGTNCTPAYSAITGSNYTFGFSPASLPPYTGHQWITGNTPFIVETFTGASGGNFSHWIDVTLTGASGTTKMFKSTACTKCYCLPAVFRGSICPITTISTTIGPPCPNPPCDPDPEIIRLCDGSTYTSNVGQQMAGPPIPAPAQPAATLLPVGGAQADGWVLGYEDCMSLEVDIMMMPVVYLSSMDSAERLDYNIVLTPMISHPMKEEAVSYHWCMRYGEVYDKVMGQEVDVSCKDMTIQEVIAQGRKTLNKVFYLNNLKKKVDNEHYWKKNVESFCIYCVANYNYYLLTKKIRIKVSGDNEYGWKLSIKGS